MNRYVVYLAVLLTIMVVTFVELELHRTVIPDSLSEPTGAPPTEPLQASDVNSLREENATQQRSSEAGISRQRLDEVFEILRSLRPNPLNLQASVTGFGAESEVTLSWDAVHSAVGYRVYRSSPRLVEIGTTETTSFTDRGPGVGKWEYLVAAYTSTDQLVGAQFAYVIVRLPVPAGLVAEADASTPELDVRLTWNAVADADGYFVYRGGPSDLAYLGYARTAEFVDYSPIVGANSYQVAAHHYGKRHRILSHLSDIAVANIAELERMWWTQFFGQNP